MPVAPPRPKGPHLNALRAFEAAARLGSFTAAAEELSVTPGAITQHVKSLEAWTESKLFQRNARGVALTPLAEKLLPEFTRAFDQLGHAVHALRTKAAPQKIRIATLPAIAQLWLAPRLGLLRQKAPEISVSVVALENPPNLDREPFDLSLFFTSDAAASEEVEVFRDRIFPVCAPDIAARLRSVSDLVGETLLHDTVWADDWACWLAEHGEGFATAGPAVEHSLFSVALEEARHGGGVLMAHAALVETALRRGELIRPFPQEVTLPRRLVARGSRPFLRSDSYSILINVLKQTSSSVSPDQPDNPAKML